MRHLAIVMPVPTGLLEHGPLVDVVLTPSPAVTNALLQAGQPIPAVPAKVMVDTGAQRTLVDKALIEQLNIAPIRFQQIVGVSGKPEPYPVYPLTITLKFGDGQQKVDVSFGADIIAMPSSARLHRGLLGRDFLANFEFFYDGPRGHVVIQMPAQLRSRISPPEPQATRADLPETPIPAPSPAALPAPRPRRERRDEEKARRKAQRKARKKNRGQ